jgi:hypothetical protein
MEKKQRRDNTLLMMGFNNQLNQKGKNGRSSEMYFAGHYSFVGVCVGDGNDEVDDNLALRASNDRIGKWNGVFLDIMELINNHNTALMKII